MLLSDGTGHHLCVGHGCHPGCSLNHHFEEFPLPFSFLVDTSFPLVSTSFMSFLSKVYRSKCLNSGLSWATHSLPPAKEASNSSPGGCEFRCSLLEAVGRGQLGNLSIERVRFSSSLCSVLTSTLGCASYPSSWCKDSPFSAGISHEKKRTVAFPSGTERQGSGVLIASERMLSFNNPYFCPLPSCFQKY